MTDDSTPPTSTDRRSSEDAPAAGGTAGPAGEDPSPETDRATTPDLRVARVKEAREHPNADRLLVLDIDLGDQERQLVAGVAGKYEPGELGGLHIVVVTNLKPAKLRGEISQGMLLAAEPDDTLGLLLAPDAEPGTRLRAGDLPEPPDEITIDEFGEHTLVASPEGVTMDGEPVEGARLVMDRQMYGRLR